MHRNKPQTTGVNVLDTSAGEKSGAKMCLLPGAGQSWEEEACAPGCSFWGICCFLFRGRQSFWGWVTNCAKAGMGQQGNVCLGTHICMHVCRYVYVYTQRHVHVGVHVWVSVCMCVGTYMRTHVVTMSVCVHAQVCVCAVMYVYMYRYIYVLCTCAHVCVLVFVYVCV